MVLGFWTRFIGFLLPKSRAFAININKQLRQLFEGLAIIPKTIHDHLGDIFLDFFPLTTTKLLEWSQHFGYSKAITNSKLLAEWQDGGGQSPDSIQTRLQASGFDAYVHEWWVPGSNPVTARDPIPYIDNQYTIDATKFQSGANLLVNRQQIALKNWEYECGDTDIECGDDIQLGEWNGLFMFERGYVVEDDEDLYPYYQYICAETWPNPLTVLDIELDELIRLIYKFKPLHQRIVLIYETRNEYWEDTLGGSPILEDTLGGSPVVEDVI